MAKRLAKKGSGTKPSTRGSASPRHEDFKSRLNTLTTLAAQLGIDYKYELEKAGDDPIVGIGVLAHGLGLDVISVLNPATNIDDLIASTRAMTWPR